MRRPSAQRAGMTLVELLTVITIMVILIAVAVPVMRPALKDRKLREASRQVNTFIALAKSKAVEAGRPHGIYIARDANNPNSAYQIFLAETPLPYAGDYLGATAKMLPGSAPTGYAGGAELSDIQDLVNQGDYIQFAFKGPHYLITGVDEMMPPKKVYFQPAPGEPWPRCSTDQANPTSLTFQVFRQPVRMATQPMQLPTGTVIDLENSGFGVSLPNAMNGRPNAGQEFKLAPDASMPADLSLGVGIGIMFTPTGSVERIYRRTYGEVANETIHLLIGRVEQISALEPNPLKQNLRDGGTSWVSIGHQTGTVTTAENYVVNPASVTVQNAREIAQKKQTTGGR